MVEQVKMGMLSHGFGVPTLRSLCAQSMKSYKLGFEDERHWDANFPTTLNSRCLEEGEQSSGDGNMWQSATLFG